MVDIERETAIWIALQHGYGEIVANGPVKFPRKGFDGKLLFY
jgi:hypothetical protein